MKSMPAQNKQKPRSKWRVWKILLTLIVIAAIAIIGTVAYHHHQNQVAIDKERLQYKQTEKDIAALAASIVATSGKPEDKVQDNSCGYTSNTNEFAAHGDLYCNIGIDLLYPATNLENAIILAKTINAQIIIGSSLGNSVHLVNGTSSLQSEAWTSLLFTKSYEGSRGLNCGISFVYSPELNDPTSSGFPKSILDIHTGLLVEISCGSRPAKAAYYPIKD